MLRRLKAGAVFLIAAWGFLSILGNVSALGASYGVIKSITTMPWFAPGEGPPWGTGNPAVVWTCLGLLLVCKFVTMVLALYGGRAMWRARDAEGAVFDQSKYWAIFAGLFSVVWLYGGFTLIGEHFFMMVLNAEGVQSGQSAFRYAGFAGLITLMVALPDREGR